ncbi:ExbD/TolR family protein [Thauera butanivorans]|uniref:ExbD/TolR family protein n=1 Tax=Thauera butanivorans TaxID=86174 RepID=UPI000837BEEE|nr:biopolymer transporter ExbD [Thauera butanivorans]
MAFGGFNNGDSRPLQSEINMVPLIDVMLVLLIVFMITAPLLTHSVKIDLPQASSQPNEEKPETVSLAINGEGQLFWNNEPLDDVALPLRLQAAAEQKPQPELHLRADRETRYQKLAEVMSQAREAGIEKMGFITLPESEAAE